MRSLKDLIVPSVISVIFLFSIGYAMKNTISSLTDVLNWNTTEFFSGSDNPTNFQVPPDASAMFNERGFYKSNSFSFDENEIIGDYNGNLIYSFPLGYSKGPGDMYMDLKLTYNGSMNYQAMVASLTWANFTNIPQYNFTAPGWVFSVNGMAVQMLNFESNFFTKQGTPADTNLENKEIRLLATGYQLTDRMKQMSGGQQDVILIMRGDGSVIDLKHIDNDCGSTSEECYTGNYYSDNKGSYIRAYVEFIEDFSWPEYRNRRATVMMGDGLSYIYEEQKISYYDYPLNTGSWFLRPQIFLLKKIKDKFGNVIDLTYAYNLVFGGTPTTVYGRPIITSVSGSWPGSNAGFQYSKGAYGVVVTSSSGKYKIFTDQFDFGSGDIHRTQVNQIENPFSDVCAFDYESYTRFANEVNNPIATSPQFINLKFSQNTNDGLKRMTKFTNYNGGIRKYIYYGSNSLNIDMNPTENQKIQSGEFVGQGRDPFFTNMLRRKVSMIGTDSISAESFDYPYTDINSDRLTNPVDENDSCHTKRVKQPKVSTYTYETPNELTSLYSYKNFKLHTYVNNVENPDWPGETKLLFEQHFTVYPDSMFKGINYKYYTGSPSSGEIYSGSFLLKEIKEQLNSAVKTDSFEYIHTSDVVGVGTEDEPIKEKVEYDPYGLKTVTKFDTTIYEESIHYRYAKYNAYENLSNQDYDTTFIYLINIPISVEKYKSSTLLYKEEMNYLSENGTAGYVGQLTDKRVYDVSNLSNYLETQFKYFHNDTTGRYLYTVSGTKPSVEGNLKEIIDPKGNSTKYYYHPVQVSGNDPYTTESFFDAPPVPVLKAIKVFDTGNITYDLQQWEDRRLPTRVDSYVSGSRYISNFMMYDYKGNVSKNVNPNLYLSTFTYDAMGRINVIVLPHDYDTLTVQDSVTYDTSYTPGSYVIESNAWGRVNTDANPDVVEYITDVTTMGLKFNTGYYRVGGGPDAFGDSARFALVGFNATTMDNIMNSFTDITYANLEFYPTKFFHIVGDDSSNAVASVKIKTLSGYSSGSYTSTSYSVNTDISEPTSDSLNCRGTLYPTSFIPYYNIVNVTAPLQSHLSTSTAFRGFMFDQYTITGTENPPIQFVLDIGYCITSTNYIHWYRPVLKMGGITRYVDTLRFKRYSNATFKYVYDDEDNIVTVNAKIDKAGGNYRYKKSETVFDQFYRVWRTKNYPNLNSLSDTNVFITKYNYLDQKAQTIDAVGNGTKFSYDKYGSASYTKNTDSSVNVTANEYMSSLTTTFYTISSAFINKKTYTDETGRQFEKYFDGVGRMLREVKYVPYSQSITNPPDPDTTTSEEAPPTTAVYTDYKYDDLYRVIEVKTPEGKHIYYQYDGFGRQSQKTTPDAGVTKYWYDRNNNLTYTQDEVQRDFSPQKYTLRTYDGMNRLLTTSEETPSDPNVEEDNPTTGNVFTINCYDSLAYASVGSIFTNVPSDFQPNTANYNTKGSVVATAYRTKLNDAWNYKFYRYDARGRVIKLWHYLAGLGWKTENYSYNSQNQLKSNWYQPSKYDSKLFVNSYDDAARLNDVSLYVGTQPATQEDDDAPSSYLGLSSYKYNKNSQLDSHLLNLGQYINRYTYTNRNWVYQMVGSNAGSLFKYTLLYNLNGNIRYQDFQGSYKDSFGDNSQMRHKYYYDQSNRLTYADDELASNNTFDLRMTYDFDGNITAMKRYGSSNNLVDDFTYEYFSGTNRLQKVGAVIGSQYDYDSNGNMTKDVINQNYNILYDHRNLMTDIRTIRQVSEGGPVPVDVTYWTLYKYDEAGNRVKKETWKYLGEEPDPIFNEDSPSGWQLVTNEFYVRDVAGKEIAIYSDTTLSFWNIWGLDNVGKINSDTTKNYYLKDHLGSIRCVISSTNSVVSAQDYDAWGYVMENRSYNAATMKYDFTGKEKDNETNYDYFGARYYDGRIGRWGQVEPLFNSYISVTPYSYTLNNPIILFDPNGNDVRATSSEAQQMILNTLPKDLHGNIIFDDQGYIDKTMLNSITSESGNFEALKQLVNDSRLYDVEIGTGFKYGDEYGNVKSTEFGEIYIDHSEEASPFSPQTGEKGWYGVTTIPGNEPKAFNSTGDYVGIYINQGLSDKGRAQIFSHEGYGHGYLYSLGLKHGHDVINVNGDWVETNEVLGNQIKRSIQETIVNMEGK